MADASISIDTLKQAMKEALQESLTEQRELFRDVVAEVIEDFAMVEAIEEGRDSSVVSRKRILDVLEDGE